MVGILPGETTVEAVNEITPPRTSLPTAVLKDQKIGCRKKRSHFKWGALFNNLLNMAASFLLSRSLLPGGIFPAGIGYGMASRKGAWPKKLLICLGYFGGSFTIKGWKFALGSSLVLLIFYLGDAWYFRAKVKHLPILVGYGIWTTFGLGWWYLSDYQPYVLVTTLLEAAAGYVLSLLFLMGQTVLDNPLKRHTKLARATLGLLLILVLNGTYNINLTGCNLDLTKICSVFALLTVAYLGGGGVGAAMGSAMALVLGITTGGLVSLMSVYGITGFLSGFLKELGKWGSLIGMAAGWYFVASQFGQGQTLVAADSLPWGIGMASFILVPRRYLSQMSNYFSDGLIDYQTPEKQQRLREVIISRLNDLAEIFSELSKSFNDEQRPPLEKIDLYSLLDQVCIKNCQHCTGYESCWGENFYSTYRELFDLIALAELYGAVDVKHLKGRLAQSCFQQFKLLETVNHLFEKCIGDYSWQNKLNECKNFLAYQLQGVSTIINSLAVEINTDACFKLEVEEKLRSSFNRIGLYVKEAAVTSFKDDSLEIKIKKSGCNQKRSCQYIVAPLISKLLGEEYSVWERRCQLDKGDCSFCLTPSRNYEVRTAVCKLSKNENELCGDNHALHNLKDGHFVAILSDGMGHGSKAAMESNTTVKLLEKLLETGVNRDFAVKMVNSVLLMRTPEETFATIDLAMIDLYNAQAEFIKIGAAVTYVKRGKEIWSITSRSLPAGILNTVDIERTVIDLQAGDLIVLVTDGVVDSRPTEPGKEDWITRALRQVEVVGPEALGEYLLNLARINQEGQLKDDMTVIVLQLTGKEL